MQQPVKFIGINTGNRSLFVNQPFFDHIYRNLHSRLDGAFSVSGLQHEQPVFLNGKLNVLHISEMFFQGIFIFHKLRIDIGHFFLQILNRFRCTDTGNDIFALGINKEFAVKFVLARGRIPGKTYASSGSDFPCFQIPWPGHLPPFQEALLYHRVADTLRRVDYSKK